MLKPRDRRAGRATSDELGYAELRAGGSRVVIVPALGGKITVMEIAGREWLWTNDAVKRRPTMGASTYADVGDTGGYDECFPSVAPCQLPSWVGSYGHAEIADHGELWAQRPMVHIETAADGNRIITYWEGRALPYDFARMVAIGPDGVVRMQYEVLNLGTERIPFIWSAQPMLPLTAETRLDMPRGTQVRVAFERRIDLGGEGALDVWPEMSLGARGIDLSRPGALPNRHYACKLFFYMTEGWAAVEEADARLELRFDPAEVPNFGLWINHHAWRPPHHRAAAPANVGFEPCIGVPDSLSEALGKWESAYWLEPSERRAWTLEWRGVRRAPRVGLEPALGVAEG